MTTCQGRGNWAARLQLGSSTHTRAHTQSFNGAWQGDGRLLLHV